MFQCVSVVSAYFGLFRPVCVIRPEYFFGFLFIYFFLSFHLTDPKSHLNFDLSFFSPPSSSSSFFFFLFSAQVSLSLCLFFTFFFFFLSFWFKCRPSRDVIRYLFEFFIPFALWRVMHSFFFSFF